MSFMNGIFAKPVKYMGLLFINDSIMITFGKKLREARDAKGISQSELARLLNTNHSIIGKYERDEVKPTVDVVRRLADNLDTTVGFLLGESEDMNLLKDPSMLKRLNEINELPSKEKEALLLNVDAFLRDFRTRKAYAS